ncbi:MAG TPA: hypothetical protein VGH99_17005 [Pseudonocardia sp.]|jgi:hypothetical protein
MTHITDAALRRDLEAVRDQLQTSLNAVNHLLAGPSRKADERVMALPRSEAVIWALDHDHLPMSPAQIADRLQEAGRDDPTKDVQTSAFRVWQQGRIAKLARGVYCSLEDVPPGMPRFVYGAPHHYVETGPAHDPGDQPMADAGR